MEIEELVQRFCMSCITGFCLNSKTFRITERGGYLHKWCPNSVHINGRPCIDIVAQRLHILELHSLIVEYLSMMTHFDL